jgi:hypothetical protein
MSYNICTNGGSMSSNEITIKINFSDSLLNKISNLLLISNSAMPIGVALQQPKNNMAEKQPVPIGFKK